MTAGARARRWLSLIAVAQGLWPWPSVAAVPRCSSQAAGYECPNAQGPGIWHTMYSPDAPGPHFIDIPVGGIFDTLTYQARGDGGSNGTLRRFRVYLDGTLYAEGDCVATPGGGPVVLVYGPARTVQTLRLQWLAGIGPWASADEVRVTTRCAPDRWQAAVKWTYPDEAITTQHALGFKVYPAGVEQPCAVSKWDDINGHHEARSCAGLDRSYPVMRDLVCEPGKRVEFQVTALGDNCESVRTAPLPLCCPCLWNVGRETYQAALARCPS